MPRYDYVCDDGHTTERIVPLSAAPGPKKIKCLRWLTNSRGRPQRPEQQCGKQAKRVEVYTPSVNGTPTRGAF